MQAAILIFVKMSDPEIDIILMHMNAKICESIYNLWASDPSLAELI
jgi:hypothetical protein